MTIRERPGTDEDVFGRAAANCAGAYRTWAERLGKRTRVWDDVSVADLELPVALSANNATLLRSPADDRDLLARLADFFSGRPGGGYTIWSLWPIPELDARGVDGRAIPCMIREPGGESRPPPADLEVVEVDDDESVRQAESLIVEVFGAGAGAGNVLTVGCLDDRLRVWVGRVDGRPVSTSMAYVGDGFVGVYCVATAADARGRGYGEALTWAATRSRPDLPATLQASSMGRPVYERMGFRTVAEFTVWALERRNG
ncbi:MAG TPA: GNAT family N-acetyltransferase [Actinomycetota bacterium]|nr:GNAT family N-acetyltransferase [Actinomycetota bacterium]